MLIANWSRLHQLTRTCVMTSLLTKLPPLLRLSLLKLGRLRALTTCIQNSSYTYTRIVYDGFSCYLLKASTRKSFQKCGNSPKSLLSSSPVNLQTVPKSYRPISLLCIAYKLYEHLIYNWIKPVVESVLPKKQAGFRQGRCTLDQVALPTEDIETSFDKRMKPVLS